MIQPHHFAVQLRQDARANMRNHALRPESSRGRVRRVIDVFDGNGAPSGPNCALFSGADRLLEASRGRSGSG